MRTAIAASLYLLLATTGHDGNRDYRPVVIMYTTESCIHCDLATTRIAEIEELPFVVVKVNGDKQKEIDSFPEFRWYASTGQYMRHVGSNITGKQSGLLDKWKYSMRYLPDDEDTSVLNGHPAKSP